MNGTAGAAEWTHDQRRRRKFVALMPIKSRRIG